MKSGFLKTFTSSQRKGIFVLLLIIVLIQVALFLQNKSKITTNSFDEASVAFYQNQIDSLKLLKSKKMIYPFNPNYIDEEKGYFLKMRLEEIDKLKAFRNTNKYVNSAKEFQQVTGVSDEWLAIYGPYFKFPEWTQRKTNQISNSSVSSNQQALSVKDINKATKDDLMEIRGIGPAYAERILTERDKFGGFVHIDQVKFVYGLSPDVQASLKKYFKIGTKPSIRKINLNTASKEELSKIPYINYQLVREILIYRSKSDELLKIEDMKKIKGFPLDKLNIIALYLDN